jgi:hypothetical protein
MIFIYQLAWRNVSNAGSEDQEAASRRGTLFLIGDIDFLHRFLDHLFSRMMVRIQPTTVYVSIYSMQSLSSVISYLGGARSFKRESSRPELYSLERKRSSGNIVPTLRPGHTFGDIEINAV